MTTMSEIDELRAANAKLHRRAQLAEGEYVRATRHMTPLYVGRERRDRPTPTVPSGWELRAGGRYHRFEFGAEMIVEPEGEVWRWRIVNARLRMEARGTAYDVAYAADMALGVAMRMTR